MPNNIAQINDLSSLKTTKTLEVSLLLVNIKNSLWLFGIPSWIFGISDRTLAALADGYLSPIEVLHLFTASFFFVSWLYLKPQESWIGDEIVPHAPLGNDLSSTLDQAYFPEAKARMLELQDKHLIGQEYILPFHYLCQIYHLLNLKHLETIHSFSLNNLKVIKANKFQTTPKGGFIQFQTRLDSPFNPLKIWRQPIVEVDLILHTPYTVELRIPAHNNKKIIVIFNVLPLGTNQHKFSIDIYSDLDWPRPLLQIVLHFAAGLTLFEDLPYLRKLAERNIHRLFKISNVSQQETMWLFQRFVYLYGSQIEYERSLKTISGETLTNKLAPVEEK